MPTMFGTSPGDTDLAYDEEFVDLICADEELLRAEFDAIVAAAWSGPPPDEPARQQPDELQPDSTDPVPPVRCARMPNRPRRPGTDGVSRQRSPPRRGSHEPGQQEEVMAQT